MTVAIKANGMKDKRVIYTCKKCGTTLARDYKHQDGNCRLFRVEGDRVVWQEYDGRCECGSRFKATFVQAVVNEQHTCNAACINAKGQNCSCECGGENHGKSFLI